MRDSVAAQAVGNEAPRFVLLPLRQSLEEALGCRPVPLVLRQDV